MSAVADKLREARALVERGWTQGQFDDQPYFSAPVSCVCALGAIMHAHRMETADSSSIKALRKLPDTEFLRQALGVEDIYGKEPHVRSSIVAWNDAKGRTQAEVLAAFDKAIELAESEQ